MTPGALFRMRLRGILRKETLQIPHRLDLDLIAFFLGFCGVAVFVASHACHALGLKQPKVRVVALLEPDAC